MLWPSGEGRHVWLGWFDRGGLVEVGWFRWSGLGGTCLVDTPVTHCGDTQRFDTRSVCTCDQRRSARAQFVCTSSFLWGEGIDETDLGVFLIHARACLD